MTTSSSPHDAVNSPSFWDQHYQNGRAGWDLGRPAPPFEDLLSGADSPSSGRIAVLGCGRGHDALLFAQHGFTVTGFDFAPTAVAEARMAAERESLSATFVEANILALPDSYDGTFDCVLEHTFFCAIDPLRRPEYVEVVRRLLRPDGLLIGLFFAHGRPGGPPFTTDADEVRRLFEGLFAIEQVEVAANSVEQRRGHELFVRMRRR